MAGRPYRVALWGTGDVGHYVIRGVTVRDDLELVGVRVWNESKVGRDAGELVGWDRIGVTTTNSTQEILDLAPDVLIHAGPSRTLEPVPEFLAAGIDVITLCSARLVHPASAPDEVRLPIEAACAQGGSTAFYGGIDPGFAAHTLPIVLSGISERIDLLVSYEVRDYDPLPLHQLEYFAYGRTTTEGARFFEPGGIRGIWEAPLRLIADALGVTLERTEEFIEVEHTTETFDVPALTVEAGTIAAARLGLSGFVDGVERLRIEHVNRLRRDLAPQWLHRQGYGVVIEGQPNYHLHLDLWDPAGKQQRPALWGTAMYMVNAVPQVVAAAPGIATVLDLPHIVGRGVGGLHQDDDWTVSKRIIAGERRVASP